MKQSPGGNRCILGNSPGHNPDKSLEGDTDWGVESHAPPQQSPAPAVSHGRRGQELEANLWPQDRTYGCWAAGTHRVALGSPPLEAHLQGEFDRKM